MPLFSVHLLLVCAIRSRRLCIDELRWCLIVYVVLNRLCVVTLNAQSFVRYRR